MIVTKEVEITGNSRNIKHFKEKGIDISVGEKMIIGVEHLLPSSKFRIDVKCDTCETINNMMYGTLMRYSKNDINAKYYCKDCCAIKRLETNNIKYGGNSPTCSKEIVDKIKETNQEKYGNNSSLHGSRQSITENIFLEKYGTKTPAKLDATKEKARDTCFEKYGGPAPLCDETILNKVKLTNLERRGYDNVSKDPVIIEKIKNIFFDKYGDYYVRTDEMKEKAKDTCLEKYGTENYNSSDEYKKILIDNKSEKLGLDIISYNENTFKIKCDKCEEYYEINNLLLSARLRINNVLCTICNPLGSNLSSSYEYDLCDCLTSNGIVFSRNDKNIIPPYHVDIFIPEHNFAIEINGLYWHSEKFKNKNYHYDKYSLCKGYGVYLFQIWEDDWIYKKDRIKAFIINRLNYNKNIINSKKCIVKEIDDIQSKEFIENNHVCDYLYSDINLGLFYNNKLISLMSFNGNVLNIFCNLYGYFIIDAEIMLFNYYLINYDFSNIIYYSDNCISDEIILKKLGFKKEENMILKHYWVKGHIKYYFENANETEMYDKGYYKLYSAGGYKWV